MKELRALLHLAWPMITTQFFIMATGFFDTAMAGHYSAADLAGVSLAGSVLWPLFFLLTGITMALSPITAQLRGSGDVSLAGPRIRQGLWISVGASVVLIACLANSEWLFRLAQINPTTTAIGVGYLQGVCWGAPAVMAYVALRNTCEGLGHTVPPMLIAGAVLPVNAFLNYALIYGAFGFPELGGVGCGYATAAVFWLQLGLMMVVIRRPFFRATDTFRRWAWPELGEIRRILTIGLPIGLTMFVEMAVFAVIGFLIGRMGDIPLAAHSIAGNLNWLTYVIPSTLGAAAGIRVGYFVGANDLAAARSTAGTAYRFAFVYALVVSLLLVLLRHQLVLAYSSDADVLALAATLLLFIAFYQIVDDTQAVAGGTLRGYKDTRVPMVYGLVGYWLVGVPLGIALAFGAFGLQPMGVYGFWTALTLGLTLVAIAMGVRLYRTCHDEARTRAFARL